MHLQRCQIFGTPGKRRQTFRLGSKRSGRQHAAGGLGHQRVYPDFSVFEAGFGFMNSNAGAQVLNLRAGPGFRQQDRVRGGRDHGGQVIIAQTGVECIDPHDQQGRACSPTGVGEKGGNRVSGFGLARQRHRILEV